MGSSQKPRTHLAIGKASKADQMDRSLSFERFLHLAVALVIMVILGSAGVPAFLALPAGIVFLVVRVLEQPHLIGMRRANSNSSVATSRNRTAIVLSSLGCMIVGGFIGYLLRPSVPAIGQLSFEHVITRGSSLRGIDAFLVPTAETSFNYLAVGAIIGGVMGVALAFALSGRKAQLSVKTESVRALPQGDIAESIRNLADLKDKGVLTEDEFQRKKTELLNRL